MILSNAQSLLVEKQLFEFWAGEPAAFLLAKPAVAIAGDPVVDSVAQEARQDAEDAHGWPQTTHVSGGAQWRIGMGVGVAVFDQHHAG